MPRKPTGNRPFNARLTPSDIEFLKQEQRRTGAATLSSVMEEALQKLLDETNDGQSGITLVPSGEKITKRKYMLSEALLARMQKARRHVGFNVQQMARAAIARLRG